MDELEDEDIIEEVVDELVDKICLDERWHHQHSENKVLS